MCHKEANSAIIMDSLTLQWTNASSELIQKFSVVQIKGLAESSTVSLESIPETTRSTRSPKPLMHVPCSYPPDLDLYQDQNPMISLV